MSKIKKFTEKLKSKIKINKKKILTEEDKSKIEKSFTEERKSKIKKLAKEKIFTEENKRKIKKLAKDCLPLVKKLSLVAATALLSGATKATIAQNLVTVILSEDPSEDPKDK